MINARASELCPKYIFCIIVLFLKSDTSKAKCKGLLSTRQEEKIPKVEAVMRSEHVENEEKGEIP